MPSGVQPPYEDARLFEAISQRFNAAITPTESLGNLPRSAAAAVSLPGMSNNQHWADSPTLSARDSSRQNDYRQWLLVQSVATCIDTCKGLLQEASHDMLDKGPKSATPLRFASKSTVGMTLLGCKVEHTIIGGPAHNVVNEGDVVVLVDNQPVTAENVTQRLLGGDVPGSIVLLTLKDSGGRTRNAAVARMDSSLIADKRQLFEKLVDSGLSGSPGRASCYL